jgi:hypothetical protein
MVRAVVHRQIYKPSAFGGVTNTTLCGRVSNASDDLNVEGRSEDVTCKFCLGILDKGVHVRLRWLDWKPPAE